MLKQGGGGGWRHYPHSIKHTFRGYGPRRWPEVYMLDGSPFSGTVKARRGG